MKALACRHLACSTVTFIPLLLTKHVAICYVNKYRNMYVANLLWKTHIQCTKEFLCNLLWKKKRGGGGGGGRR